MHDLIARISGSFGARAILSGVLLGLSYPPSPVPSLAFIAFLPFLAVFEAEVSGQRFVRLTYVFLVAFHCTTVYWTGGFTHANDQWMMIAGAALLFLHPWFMMPFVSGAWWVRRTCGPVPGYGAFISLWLMFEFFHERGELSFPWMAVGNSQAYDLYRIQLAELVSVQGIGLQVLLFNVLAFVVIKMVSDGVWSMQRRRGRLLLAGMAFLYVAPLVYGWIRVDQVESEPMGKTVQVGVVQPDVDPWEKWGSRTSRADIESQIAGLDSMTRSLPAGNDLVLWPETAVPAYLLLPQYGAHYDSIRSLALSLHTNILTGLPHARYFDEEHAPVTSRRVQSSDSFVESYNSALLVNRDGTTGPIYGKVVLVPFAERLPHADLLAFLIEPLKWNVGISSWGKGQDTTVFRIGQSDGDSALFSAMICYESVYPTYVRSFVEQGAEFLVVITNNSWWDRTSGPYQHAAYASLRAVENRRWVVQCANGGVSAVVHPSGRPMVTTGLFERASFMHVISRRTDTTLYTRYGDWLGQLNVVLGSGVFLYAMFVRWRKKNEDDRPEK